MSEELSRIAFAMELFGTATICKNIFWRVEKG